MYAFYLSLLRVIITLVRYEIVTDKLKNFQSFHRLFCHLVESSNNKEKDRELMILFLLCLQIVIQLFCE